MAGENFYAAGAPAQLLVGTGAASSSTSYAAEGALHLTTQHVAEHMAEVSRQVVAHAQELSAHVNEHVQRQLTTATVTVTMVKVKEPEICEAGGSGLLLPLFGDDENVDWPKGLRQFLYLIGTLWCFLGVAIIADVFMGAIEKVTSVKKTIRDPASGRTTTIKVWNDTVANLTLMALGSSAPEILLSCIELFSEDFHSGALGPSTIVGSAAFNLLVIIAVCVIAIPSGEIRKIKDLGVFAITAICSVWAYIWLLVILQWTTEDIVTVAEGVISFLYFPVLVLIAYLADIGVLCQKTTTSSVISASDLTKEELAELTAKIQKQHGGAPLSEEQLAQIMAYETQSHSRAARRVEATRRGTGSKKIRIPGVSSIMGSVGSNTISPEGKERKGKQNVMEVGFLEGTTFAILESGQKINMAVKRTITEGTLSIRYATRDGTATAGEDFVHIEGTLTFNPGEAEKTVTVEIIDDDIYEGDELFYVDLSEASGPPGVTVEIPKLEETATITIIDDDLPGVFCFEKELLDLQESTEDCTQKILVQRRGGSTGTVTCKYATEEDSATKDRDYEHIEGELTFLPGEVEKVISVRVLARGRYEALEKFRVILTEATGGASFSADTDGGEESGICTISIIPNEERKQLVDKATGFLKVNADKMAIGNANYRDQFVSALYVNGSPEEQAEAGAGDWVFHILTVFWKLLFAIVPPTDYANGWVCFFCSLIMIGVLTAIIGDLAALLGCVLGLPASVTAITFVALGTSLPDLFASKTSAEQDEYADASVGNVTGSNSVNVFLGLGLPWMIGAFYWNAEGRTPEWEAKIAQKKLSLLTNPDLKDGGFVVVAGSLGYSVTIFTLTAFACLGTLVLRRYLYGGELGGPAGPKWATFAFFCALWGVYISLSSIKALDEED
ncbi:unnamed protein product [Amoebophrya sp. A120]|nr:unnamed protein product [Amoebophrya sp. A120]|eukprot:GSA120T00017371001.1